MSNRQALVVANWKMNGSLEDNNALIKAIAKGVSTQNKAEIVICPPFVYLSGLAESLQGTGISLGAQNVSHLEKGAYTGEVSPAMLKDFNCQYVIVGHSERRMLYAESDNRIAEKFLAVKANKMNPILCVGELLIERESNETETVIARQLDAVIEMAGIHEFEDAVIAYEPVWAIGTGKTATPEQAQEVHEFIRLRLARYDDQLAAAVRIIYGGSVKADNAEQLFNAADIDGGLVGGASLIANDFLTICHAVR